ncbi:beta-ketoacyl synthase N-terminal-like domain-containing protein [Maribacter sp. 1_MG-2023]|uniref:beta-ketoacyl synthase N-terminal-like domain-containing protein n=1 Tax=Maribacter sp. 1_MG-2023 TaxID=3062677 RepID=UPI0026E2E53B|nr:beta-ketoacyl synthase N-terminal-like domain-containing protein [Maribacter sp. 1_MG-2023]MDO6471187.1 beta-ketoacyl synthase N-terminal-like domain-containing protein [Maribacter sp. 1_MG-2023]
MKEKISITAITSMSPLGSTLEETWQSYQNDDHYFSLSKINDDKTWMAPLSKSAKLLVEELRESDSKYRKLDDSVLFAMVASRMAVKQSGWENTAEFGINMGSSRGATKLFEQYHSEYLATGISSTLSSPTTTLGNISSWVSHDLGAAGPEISHSITCSTGLHSVLNGVAWLNSGMATKFLVGASEAPLTNFTIAQMKALKIYAKVTESNSGSVVDTSTVIERSRSYPCQALNLKKEYNSMILGEAASVACLEWGVIKNALAIIDGVGYATEILKHNTSISANAICFQKSMKMALGDLDVTEVDAIVMHAPGTIKGDSSEYNAIQEVFGDYMPQLTTNKWKIGHTFATSGMLNLELAVLMLQHNQMISVPFLESKSNSRIIKKVLVNAVGFGGNAVSILVSKSE